jgi:hypothetical protein
MEGEKMDSPGLSRPLSATRRRERDRPEMFRFVGGYYARWGRAHG